MIALALSLAIGEVGDQPAPSFAHRSFCQQMQKADVRPGTVIDLWTKHGGISVDCDHRVVVIQTLRRRPVTKNWLKTDK